MPGEKNYSRNVMQDAQLAEFEKELERKDMSLEDYMKQVRTHSLHARATQPPHLLTVPGTLRTCAWNAATEAEGRGVLTLGAVCAAA